MTRFADVFGPLLGGAEATGDLVRVAFESIFAGEWTPVQVGAFASVLRARGETAEQIVAAATALRAAMTPVDHGLATVLDTCGTGGDGAGTLNLSTAAAVVVAAAGIPVAKHGNRSVSSRCGSADVVEALGVPLDVPLSRQAEVLREAKLAFLFAPAHHPALRHAAQARRELGVRTIFNALGPLANPARATHQLLGVYDDGLRPVAARALGLLGVTRAWVVRSVDGLDELSPAAPTRVSELLATGEVREREVSPEDFGLIRVGLEALAGGDAQANAQALKDLLGGAPHPARGAVVLNAAAALAVATGDELRACAERADALLRDGAGLRTLQAWQQAATAACARGERP